MPTGQAGKFISSHCDAKKNEAKVLLFKDTR
jgi:hypothetical protein